MHRRADMPIKSMITLFFLPREHTAITEQEKTACFLWLQVILKSTIQLNWVTTLPTEIHMKFPEGQRQPLSSPSCAMTGNELQVEQTGKHFEKEEVGGFHTERNPLQKRTKLTLLNSFGVPLPEGGNCVLHSFFL